MRTILRSRALPFSVALVLGCATTICPPAKGVVSAAIRANGWTQFTVEGDLVRIYRDDFGVPHVFAETNRALFAGFGYTVAEDRLWQLELFRRASYGQLAEILGASAPVSDLAIGTPNALEADRRARINGPGYTSAELDALVATLNAEEQEVFGGYVAGINRYLLEVVAANPVLKLPFEFQALHLDVPRPWTIRDSVAVTVFNGRFGKVGGGERANQTLLNALVAKYGMQTGYAMFNDARWRDDPDAPVSIPIDGATGKKQNGVGASPGISSQLAGAAETDAELAATEAVRRLWRALGIPTTLGSHGWVVSAARSSVGAPLLFGGPQVDFNTPEIFHEIQLKGGNDFNVAGVALAGVPVVVIGHTDHLAWTTTTGAGADNTDVYIETLCNGGAGYVYNGVCTAFQTRNETITVRGGAPVIVQVQRTIHGPVIASATGVKFSEKRATWMRELDEFRARLAFGRAHSFQDFAAAVAQSVLSSNILYADRVGNIAYWQAGKIPVRPEGFDPRLPLPGNGSAEWTGELVPIPASVNPQRGWLANWNSKPAVNYDTGEGLFGKQQRLLEIEDDLRQRLAAGPVSPADMGAIAKQISRTVAGGPGRQWRFLKPYFLAALDEVPPAHPLTADARAILETWDGSLYDDAVASTTLAPGQVLFSAWLAAALTKTFADELGAGVGTANMLIHVLDARLGSGSGVPPSRDYFNDADPNIVLSNSFDQALGTLGATPADWSSRPRDSVVFRHVLSTALFPDQLGTVPQVGVIPSSNRATYAQIVVLQSPVTSESILTLGQSGFIAMSPGRTAEFDVHFRDQLDLYRQFFYKPMPLFTNTQLKY